MKTTKTLLMLLAVTLSFTACDKNDDDNNTGGDLTTGIVGHYVNTSNSTDITVNKIDDTHVSLSLSSLTGSSHYEVAFTSVTMNSATAFTLNSSTVSDNNESVTYTGTGTYSGNNISLFLSEHHVPTAQGIAQGMTEHTNSVTVSATKQ